MTKYAMLININGSYNIIGIYMIVYAATKSVYA